MNAPVTIEAEASAARRRIALPEKAWKVGLVALAIAALGFWWLTAPKSTESTDNAYLQADSSEVAPRVGGLVTAVLVKDNQVVKAGDPLVRIDGRDYGPRVMAADRKRYDALLVDGFVPKRDVEQVSATAVSAASAAQRSHPRKLRRGRRGSRRSSSPSRRAVPPSANDRRRESRLRGRWSPRIASRVPSSDRRIWRRRSP